MFNFLVETKNEYTSHLMNIMTPLIFEGLQSIYRDARKTCNDEDILKIFQSYLRQIPKWTQDILNNESNRIITSSQSYGWLNDLIKATLKANLIILMYNPTNKNQNKIDKKYYQDIKISDFIHKVYIECAREFWLNPYLFYHDYPALDIKRNQRESLAIIKDCIKEAIRKLLPVKHILEVYLGENIDMNGINDDVEKVMSDVEKHNLEIMLKKDLGNEAIMPQAILPVEIKGPKTELFEGKIGLNMPQMPQMQVNPMVGGKVQHSISDQSINTRILGIINSPSKPMNALSPRNNNDYADIMNMPQHAGNSGIIKADITISDSTSSLNQSPVAVKSLDDKVKNILKKDLATDSDMETSLNYGQDGGDNYQEIFSNSNVAKKDGPKKNGNNDMTKDKEKNKHFANYFQF
jgi:hypothetical protein